MDFIIEKQSILSSLKEDMAKLKQRGGALTLPICIWNDNCGKAYMSFKGKKYYTDSTQWYDIRKFRTLMDKVINEINAKNGLMAHADEYNEDMYASLTISTKPCKEFVQLSKYLTKFAKLDISVFDLYSVSVVGKRAWNYKESDQREYYAYDANKCKRILNWLKENKKRSCLSVSIKENIVDDDAVYGRIHETETYGCKYRYLDIVISNKSKTINKTTIWL